MDDILFFYDTETTDLPLWKKPSNDPDQPHIVQLAFLLTDGEGNKIAAMDTLIKPPLSGWVMTEKAFEAHGITTEKAEAYGIPLVSALEAFMENWENSTKRIGFNEPFDARLVRIALKRAAVITEIDDWGDRWKGAPAHCVLQMSRKIVNLPPSEAMQAKNMKMHKTPTLKEAYQHFFGEPLDGAHDAMVDVNATARIFFHLNRKSED